MFLTSTFLFDKDLMPFPISCPLWLTLVNRLRLATRPGQGRAGSPPPFTSHPFLSTNLFPRPSIFNKMYSDSNAYRRLLKEIQCRRYLSKWSGPHLRNEFSTCADDDDDDDDAGDYACPVKYNKRWNTILSVVFDQTKTKFWHCPLARRRRERTKSKREINQAGFGILQNQMNWPTSPRIHKHFVNISCFLIWIRHATVHSPRRTWIGLECIDWSTSTSELVLLLFGDEEELKRESIDINLWPTSF